VNAGGPEVGSKVVLAQGRTADASQVRSTHLSLSLVEPSLACRSLWRLLHGDRVVACCEEKGSNGSINAHMDSRVHPVRGVQARGRGQAGDCSSGGDKD
jgi:hypothetical protein